MALNERGLTLPPVSREYPVLTPTPPPGAPQLRPITHQRVRRFCRLANGEQSPSVGVQEIAAKPREEIVNGLIYLIGLIVVILFILSFLGLR